MKLLNLEFVAAAMLTAASVSTLRAQPYYAAGEFNGWDPAITVMNDDGDGTWSLTITYGTPGDYHNWKVTAGSWDNQWPPSGQDVRTKVDANGMNTFHFRPGVINDGWHPTANRVGYTDPGNMAWEIVGSFDSWGSDTNDVAERQMSSSGDGLWTVNYTFVTPGTNEFKFRSPGSWDHAIGALFGNTGDNATVVTTTSNQTVSIQLDLPNGRWLAGEPLAAPTNQVTFVVNMEVPIALFDADFNDVNGFDTNGDSLFVVGDFNGWTGADPSYQLFQVPGTTLYSNTVEVVGYQDSTIHYKFYATPFPSYNWENPLSVCGGERVLVLTSTSVDGGLLWWNDQHLSDPEVAVTFQVDMSVQRAIGAFDPGYGVTLRGSFTGWGDGELTLTNHPAPDTNVYSTVVIFPYYPTNTGCEQPYKFFNKTPGALNGGWESPLTTDGGDRNFSITSASQVLPLVYYNDASPCDLLVETNFITFTVDLSQAVETDGNTSYDGTWDVYINGEFNGWLGWDTNSLANYQLTHVPGTSNYSITLPMSPGQIHRLQYKYGANAGNPADVDNEAQAGQDHVRYIRTTPGMNTYSISDVWTGTNAQNIANLQEEPLSLSVSPSIAGQVNIGWRGLSCASLESAPTIGGPWSFVSGAEGVGSTNTAATAEQGYFRLTKPSPGAPAVP